MTRLARDRSHWLIVVAFAIGMAWVEAACVYYLRAMTNRVDPYQENPLAIPGVLGPVELVREAATLVMLLTVGMLAARMWHKRLAYAAIAFGVWDIFYYVFLRLISGWPGSLFDWDILFLLPLPWWGPVLAPMCIALLMVVWGTFASQLPHSRPATPLTWTSWTLSGLGIAIALYVFMADSLHVVGQGVDVVSQVLPTSFNWSAFGLAVTLMALPVVEIAWRMRPRGPGSAGTLRELSL